MAVNLIRLFTDQVGGQLAGYASTLLNESTENTQQALSGILPTLLGSLAQKGSSKSGAEQLMGMLQEGNFDGSLLDNIGDLFGSSGGPSLDNVMKQGGGLLDSLIGGKQSSLFDMIANFAGINSKSAGTLMKMAAPLLLSLIGKRIKSQGLDLGGLMNMLSGQSAFIKSAMPAALSGIGNLLGFKGELADLGASASQMADAVGDQAKATAKAASSSGRNWLPWLIGALAVIAVIYYLLPGEEALPQATVEETSEPAQEMAGDEMGVEGAYLVGDQIEDDMDAGADVSQRTYVMANSQFPTGSASITDDMRIEVMGLAEMLAEHPDLNIRVTAYAPDSQDLANQRALAIKQLLNNEGEIDPGRIETAGERVQTSNDSRVTVNVSGQ